METTNPAPRTPLHLSVFFKKNYAREEVSGTLKNISLTGAFLVIEGEKFRSAEKIHFRFTVGGRERTITGQIIWTNSAGCGVRFLPINNRDIQIVDDLIYFVESKRNDRRSVLDDIIKKVT